MELSYLNSFQDWAEYYKKILNWEIKFDKVLNNEFSDLLLSQKEEANIQFAKFIENNYADWLNSNEKPLMSHTLFKEKVKPEVEKDKVLLLMIDNLRYDQWKVIEPLFTRFTTRHQKIITSVFCQLQHSMQEIHSLRAASFRNRKEIPEYWFNDNEEGNKTNMRETFWKIK